MRAAHNDAGSDVPKLTAAAAAATRPRSGAASASSTARTPGRPFSSTNLSATVASSRFKSFAVQYEILCKNAVLGAIAKEIPWKNLLDLFTLKFFAVGDVLWRHGDSPHELAFVLCGGFLVRHMTPVEPAASPSAKDRRGALPLSGGSQETEILETIVAEKMVKPGAGLALFAVDQAQPLRYTVVVAKFKSILLTLPIGKYRSIIKQLTAPTKAIVQELIVAQEHKLLQSLKIPVPRRRVSAVARATTAPAATHGSGPLARAASTPSLSMTATAARPSHRQQQQHHQPHHHSHGHAGDAAALSALSTLPTTSWESLQVAQPTEYEVNSSLLILHESASTGKLHIPTTMASGKALKVKMLQSTSTAVRALAKKHTTRRLSSICLPAAAAADAFPLRRQSCDIEAETLAAISNASTLLDVVPKIRIGRLLSPLKKPPTLADEDDVGATSTTMKMPRTRRLLLVADRSEPFRDDS
ncbi:hypothetical protein PINS_up000872 [Pythium insidiosum]|nr:hypothetical protein PINS_up000872 [Pythium insidiosum]